MTVTCTSVEQPGWLALREQLWPESSHEEHLEEMTEQLAAPERFATFVEYDESHTPVAFVEVSIRHDYVNGTDSSPVAFLEGIYVVPRARGRGVARGLITVAERWAVAMGCSELASDAPLENLASQAMHLALGFEETERVVFFRKALHATEST
jgi:aminoglycoside 6'-N-acetyltransferase I